MKEVLNPKVALAFGGVLIGAVAMFVGTEDDPGGLHRTVQVLNEDGQGSTPPSQRTLEGESPSEEQRGEVETDREDEADAEWASDDDLVDRAEGFDTKQEPKIGPFQPIPQRDRAPKSGPSPQGAPGPLSEEAKAEIRARFGE